MDVQVRWLDEKQKIINTHFDAPITWSDYDNAVNKVIRLASSVDYPLGIITTFGDSFSGPSGNAFPHFRRFWDALPPNVKYVINVQPRSLERVLINLFTKMFPRAREICYFASSVDDALAIVESLNIEV